MDFALCYCAFHMGRGVSKRCRSLNYNYMSGREEVRFSLYSMAAICKILCLEC